MSRGRAARSAVYRNATCREHLLLPRLPGRRRAAVDALPQLRPYFASCRLLTTYNPPYHVQNDWTDIQIGVCTGPIASWHTLWPHLKYYG